MGFPCIKYHRDFPAGMRFDRESDVPDGSVKSPADLGLDTEGNPISGFEAAKDLIEPVEVKPKDEYVDEYQHLIRKRGRPPKEK